VPGNGDVPMTTTCGRLPFWSSDPVLVALVDADWARAVPETAASSAIPILIRLLFARIAHLDSTMFL
jgi:hypothetical protein